MKQGEGSKLRQEEPAPEGPPLNGGAVSRYMIVVGAGDVMLPGWYVDRCSQSSESMARALDRARRSGADVVGCWDPHLSLPTDSLVKDFETGHADIWHAGLSVGQGGSFEMLKHVMPMTWISLKIPTDIECSSWRLSFRACLIRGEVLHQAPAALDPNFDGLDGAALDWGLRLHRAGVVIRNNPGMAAGQMRPLGQPMTSKDQLQLLTNSFGRKWAFWAASRSGNPAARLSSMVTAVRLPAGPPPQPPYRAPVRTTAAEPIRRVSVIIPSVDRPAQLTTLLDQLGVQTRPIDEVVVADQSRSLPMEEIEVPARSDGLPLRVIHLTQRGQSTARNAAIRATSGDLVVLLDDDEEVQPDLIEQHLAVLSATSADAIAGGVDVPGQPSDDIARQRVAETFPGGHSSVRRAALRRSGLFDPIFDQGPRADADLGTRLALTGALVLYVPSIRIVHHHAMQGGLRSIGARRVTRTSSRDSRTERNIPSVTQMYLGLRHWGEEETRASAVMILLSSLGRNGSLAQRLSRVLTQAVLMPDSIRQIRERTAASRRLLENRPIIPMP